MKFNMNLFRIFSILKKSNGFSLDKNNTRVIHSDIKETLDCTLTGIPSVDRVYEKYHSDEDMLDFDKTIYRLIYDNNCDEESLNRLAIDYFGNEFTFREFFRQIDKAAKSFVKLGVKKGDIVSVCMPNTPEAVISFYALNKIGAVAHMIHPLSAEDEIKYYLNEVESKFLVTVDMAYEKIMNIKADTKVEQMVVVSPGNSMEEKSTIKVAYGKIARIKESLRKSDIINLKSNICRKLNLNEDKFHIFPSAVRSKLSLIKKEIKNAPLLSEIRYGAACMEWNTFIEQGNDILEDVEVPFEPGQLAALFNTGGTTGNSKAVMHSNETFNASAVQLLNTTSLFEKGDSLYSMFPVFHGVGLSSVVHLPLTKGMKIILNPKPNVKNVLKGLMSKRVNHWAGIPTVWEPLFKQLKGKDLSFVKTVFSGADTIKEYVEEEIDQILKDGGSVARLNNGLGLTETITAVLASYDKCRVIGSIGIPLKRNSIKITKLANRILEDGTEEIYGTDEEVGYGQEGEICVRGPSVMLGYYKNKKATDAVLRRHEDGHLWLHTGDVGYVKENGVYYYCQRIKRMFVSNGYNIYPTEIERVLENHPAVAKALVVGIPHEVKGTVAKAFVILNEGYSFSDEIMSSLVKECKKGLAAYSQPYSFSFEYKKIQDLPKTLYTKTNYLELAKSSSDNDLICGEEEVSEGAKVKKIVR